MLFKSVSIRFFTLLALVASTGMTMLSFAQPESSSGMSKKALQKFLDGHQYTVNGIQRYEEIFGKDFISTGGLETTQEFVGLLGLKAGERVLDVGAGVGGGAFYMARHFGAFVEGIDLSYNGVRQARERAAELGLSPSFMLLDVMAAQYPDNSFDVIYSRDTILHIANKAELFSKFRRWLKPGGRLLISDYCVGDQPFSEDFRSYLKDRQYKLVTVEQYGNLLEQAGFEQVRAENRTAQFIDVLSRELTAFENNKETFLQQFSEKDYLDLASGWKVKMKRCAQGLHQWGLFQAVNPD